MSFLHPLFLCDCFVRHVSGGPTLWTRLPNYSHVSSGTLTFQTSRRNVGNGQAAHRRPMHYWNQCEHATTLATLSTTENLHRLALSQVSIYKSSRLDPTTVARSSQPTSPRQQQQPLTKRVTQNTAAAATAEK